MLKSLWGGSESAGFLPRLFRRQARAAETGPRDSWEFILEAIKDRPSSRKSILDARKIHAQIIVFAGSASTFLQNQMLITYAACGSPEDAHRVFLSIPVQNSYSWNAMIGVLSDHGRTDEARRLFAEMPHPDVCSWNILMSGSFRNGEYHQSLNLFISMIRKSYPPPNRITFSCAMKACAALGSTPELAPQLHGLVSKLSSSQNPQIQVSILDMYVKYGYIHQAVIQLYTMEKPTLFCWNSMIFGLSKSSSTLNNALELFHMMPERNTVSWNIIISSLNQHGFREDAISMFSEMNRQGYKSDPVTYAAALESSVAVHAQIIKLHSTADTSLGHALLNSYAKTRDLEAAGKAFDELTRPSIESWTAVISLFAQSGYHEKAITLFNQMRMVPLAPDRTSFSQFLGACSSKDHLVLGIQLHGLVSKTGYATCTIVANALMGMYSKTGIFHYVRIIFQSMTLRNVLSWNVILESFVKNGRREEVMKMYVCMLREEEARPDSVTFAILFSVCADLAVLNLGKQLLSHSARLGLDSDVAVANSAVKFYAKCGKIEEARKIFDSIGVKDLVSWNTIISGYAQNGFARKALQSFECMLQTGINPDSVTFLGLLSACRHAGLVTEGKYYFSCMGSYRNIEPAQEHFACMVDLLGRSGLVEEAKKMIDEMEIQPSVEIWGALLSSCRTHSRVELAEIAMENLLKLDSTHAGGFSLLSHVYAESGMVNATAGMRKLMKERGIKKSPGCSWLEFDGKIHVFAADESNHPKIADVMVALNMITISLRAWGYEDKGTARGHHSEKLAIAFGLMNLPSWNSIHVMKNLRVCGDCHGFCKAVSLVYGRELVIRDASRFHHFSGGFCSCQDFW